MTSVLSLASARMRKLWILFQNNLLDGALCKNDFYFYIFFFFLFSNVILSNALILPVSQLQTQQVMTSQIRSHRIFKTDLLYSCAIFLVETDEISRHNGGVLYDLMMIDNSGLFFGPPCTSLFDTSRSQRNNTIHITTSKTVKIYEKHIKNTNMHD